MTHDPARCVASAPIFAGLPADVIAQLAAISTHERPVAKGEFLYTAGSPADRLLVVDSGCVKVYRPQPDGSEQILYFLQDHAIDSEAALFTQGTHQNAAQVIEPARVCSIQRDDFERLALTTPQLALGLVSAFGHRLTALENHNARYGTLTAYLRLRRYLEDTAEQVGSDYFKLPMSKHDLASWLSVTPETLSRQFSRLVREGHVNLQGQMVRLLD